MASGFLTRRARSGASNNEHLANLATRNNMFFGKSRRWRQELLLESGERHDDEYRKLLSFPSR